MNVETVQRYSDPSTSKPRVFDVEVVAAWALAVALFVALLAF